MYYSNFMPRNQEILETIQEVINAEASTIDLYNRLATAAPNEEHREKILHALHDENVHLKHLMDYYISLTGTQPMYRMETEPFYSYEEGLQRACEKEVEGSEHYRKTYLLTQNTPYSEVFLKAHQDKKEHAERFGLLAGGQKKKRKDYGKEPFVLNIDKATKKNDTFRTALWTGDHFQVTLMSIGVGEDIGLEIHPDVDQFIRVEQGQGLVEMGETEDQLDYKKKVYDDYAIMIPAGKWHNLTNTGKEPLKLYSIYAPPEHPFGTVHKTKADAIAAEEGY